MNIPKDKKIQSRLKELSGFYADHLTRVMLPFWLTRAPDAEYGGFFTCFNPDGSQLASTDKFIWSQGRAAWLFARLATSNAPIFTQDERKNMLDISKCAAYFLAKHAFGPDGCYFLVERDGTPKEQFPGIGLSPSTLADAFVVLGLSGYAAAAGDIALLDKAIELFYKVEQKAGDKTFRTAPYIVEPGMYMSMIPMYIINLTNELHRACVALNDSRAGIIERFAKKYCDIVFNKCARPDGLILEQFDVDFNTVDSFLGRYSNPGHSVESGWFALESCAKRGDKEGIARAVTIIEKAFDSGKDAEHGGILYYVDLDGLQPRGPVVTEADAKAKPQYDKDWSNKLWWPHTEMLYGLMLAYAFTGKDSLLDKFEELHEYTFKTFPNPDESIGEWIQLRDRRGEPISNEVGGRLPVKDPYHANRNFIMLIELLDAMTMSEEE